MTTCINPLDTHPSLLADSVGWYVDDAALLEEILVSDCSAYLAARVELNFNKFPEAARVVVALSL